MTSKKEEIYVKDVKIEIGYLAIKKDSNWFLQECIYKSGQCGLHCPLFHIIDDSKIYLGCKNKYIIKGE